MRFLGHMWRAKDLTSGPLRTIVLVEMITRSVKVPFITPITHKPRGD